MKITRMLAAAVGFKVAHPDESLEDIAHDFAVEVDDLESAVDWLDNNQELLVEAIAEGLEGRVI